MKTLADAWEWYESTRQNLIRMQRIGRRYWNDIPWETATMGRDDEFRTLEASDIETEVTTSLAPIDDLAIVVLFSVFEAVVRSHLVDLIKPEAEGLLEPILIAAANDAIRGVEDGSFFNRVLGPLRDQERVSADLVTQVNQVRDYRNWVAHGRRGIPTNHTTPKQARDRLREFLDALGIAAESEQAESERLNRDHP